MHFNQKKKYIDPREMAELLYYQVEGLFDRPKPKGFFLPWRATPVIKPDSDYYTKPNRNDFGNVPQISFISDISLIPTIKKDIFDIDGNLVLRSRDARLIVTESHQPIVEVDVLEALIENIITEMSSWIAPGNKPDPFDVVKGFVIPEGTYYSTPRYVKYEDWYPDGIVMVLRMTERFLKDVTDFIGDDTTIIHTLSRDNGDFVIEKTVDYRIHEYERMKALGLF